MAASAYRSGSRITDEQTGKTHDYSRRTKGVAETAILTPENAPGWAHNANQLWNKVEAGEKRKDAQLAREFILALPKELTIQQQSQLTMDWVRKNLVSEGMIAEVSLHLSKDGNNPHAHVMCTLRKLDGDEFASKKSREWNENALLCQWRESWCVAENAALEKAGRPERVDHRSLKAQGIDRIPQPKIGKEAMGLQKRGVVEDPERCKLVRWVQALNAVMPWRRDIERHGKVQHKSERTWWERSMQLADEVGKGTRDALLDTWEKLTHRLPGRRHRSAPDREPDRGPDLSR